VNKTTWNIPSVVLIHDVTNGTAVAVPKPWRACIWLTIGGFYCLTDSRRQTRRRRNGGQGSIHNACAQSSYPLAGNNVVTKSFIVKQNQMVATHEISFSSREEKKKHNTWVVRMLLSRVHWGSTTHFELPVQLGFIQKGCRNRLSLLAREPRFLFRPELFWNSISSVRACCIVR